MYFFVGLHWYDLISWREIVSSVSARERQGRAHHAEEYWVLARLISDETSMGPRGRAKPTFLGTTYILHL